MVFRWGYSHLRTFKFIFRAKMRKWEVAKVKKQKRRRYKGESEVAKGSSFFYYHSFAFAPSPSRRRNFSLSPSQVRTSAFAFFACIHVVRYRLNIMLTVKVASAAEDELWENCLMMKFKYYCVDTMVSRLVRTGAWKCTRIMIRIEARIKNPRLPSLSRQI